MALHNQLPIYKQGYDLLSLAADVQANMAEYIMGKRYFTADQMRAYVDAERSLRRGDTGMPVGEYPPLPELLSLVRAIRLGPLYTAGQMREYAQAALAAQAVEIDGLRKDAERYRWLIEGKRSKRIWNHVLYDFETEGKSSLQDAIDAAIAKETTK